MVAINKEAKIEGVICPQCYEHLPYPVIMDDGTDNYGRELRTYFGWCFKCNKGCQTVQFKRDDKWFIHKYQLAILEDARICRLKSEWQIVNVLPEPAPIITGPGGEYNNHINLESAVPEILKTMHKALAALAEAIQGLLEIFTKNKNN